MESCWIAASEKQCVQSCRICASAELCPQSGSRSLWSVCQDPSHSPAGFRLDSIDDRGASPTEIVLLNYRVLLGGPFHRQNTSQRQFLEGVVPRFSGYIKSRLKIGACDLKFRTKQTAEKAVFFLLSQLRHVLLRCTPTCRGSSSVERT